MSKDELVDNETGSVWSIATGEAISGEMMGAEHCRQFPSPSAFGLRGKAFTPTQMSMCRPNSHVKDWFNRRRLKPIRGHRNMKKVYIAGILTLLLTFTLTTYLLRPPISPSPPLPISLPPPPPINPADIRDLLDANTIPAINHPQFMPASSKPTFPLPKKSSDYKSMAKPAPTPSPCSAPTKSSTTPWVANPSPLHGVPSATVPSSTVANCPTATNHSTLVCRANCYTTHSSCLTKKRARFGVNSTAVAFKEN